MVADVSPDGEFWRGKMELQASDVKIENLYIDNLPSIALDLVEQLKEARKHYGDSWKKRGGVGAFMMAARKFDRLETQCEKHGWDIFKAFQEDQRAEGICDDVRDLISYLLLILAEMQSAGINISPVKKG